MTLPENSIEFPLSILGISKEFHTPKMASERKFELCFAATPSHCLSDLRSDSWPCWTPDLADSKHGRTPGRNPSRTPDLARIFWYACFMGKIAFRFFGAGGIGNFLGTFRELFEDLSADQKIKYGCRRQIRNLRGRFPPYEFENKDFCLNS